MHIHNIESGQDRSTNRIYYYRTKP